jgi:hypothetical protein
VNAVLFFQSRRNLAGNGLQMRFGSCRANDKKVGERGYPAKIQDDDFLRLFVRGEFGASFR